MLIFLRIQNSTKQSGNLTLDLENDYTRHTDTISCHEILDNQIYYLTSEMTINRWTYLVLNKAAFTAIDAASNRFPPHSRSCKNTWRDSD